MTLFKILVVFMTILSSSALAAPMRVMGIDSVHANMDWQVVNDGVMGGRSESVSLMKMNNFVLVARLTPMAEDSLH